MEIFNSVIEGVNTPQTQKILKHLDSDRDVLLTSVDTQEHKIEVQCIQPINQVESLGFVPDDIASDIFEKYGENANVNINDYSITYDNGEYGLVADIGVEEVDTEEPKHKRLPLPILIVVGVLTGLLTVVLVVIKLLKALKKKNK